jgi:hypothetical protein
MDTLGQYGQPFVLEDLFAHENSTVKRFFIEAGAYDGAIGTNTLKLEVSSEQWSGLLVEPNPMYYKRLR